MGKRCSCGISGLPEKNCKRSRKSTWSLLCLKKPMKKWPKERTGALAFVIVFVDNDKQVHFNNVLTKT